MLNANSIKEAKSRTKIQSTFVCQYLNFTFFHDVSYPFYYTYCPYENLLYILIALLAPIALPVFISCIAQPRNLLNKEWFVTAWYNWKKSLRHLVCVKTTSVNQFHLYSSVRINPNLPKVSVAFHSRLSIPNERKKLWN